MASFFIFLGRPVLFFLKILLWTLVWFFQKTLQILKAIFGIFKGTFNTLSWFYKLILKFPNTVSFRPRLACRQAGPKIIFPRTSTLIPHSFLHNFILVTLGFLLCFLFIFLPYSVTSFLSALPNPKILNSHDYAVTTKILDRNGLLLYQIYSDQNRTPVKLSDLPPHLLDATVAIEDKNFYSHLGFDPAGIFRAFVSNLSSQSPQGGSTITQQLIKSALLSPERTYLRKIKELILAFWTERLYSKDQILEMYLNQVPYGGSAYGIEAAAQVYFNKHAKDLTLPESALLAGLPSAPSVYSPFGSRPELAKQRQKDVLRAMKLNPEDLDLNLTYAPQSLEIKAPHFVMYVKDLLIQKYGIKTVEQGGLEVTTTLDYSLYETAAAIIKNGVENQKYLGVGNGAALVTNPKTGEILAMVGSKDYFAKDYDGNVNVTLSLRSPGSSIKVVNYAAALEKNLISPASVIDDAPVTFVSPGLSNYSPQNYDGKFHGKVTVRTALGSSYNVPAVKILQKLGVNNMFDLARQMGINSWKDLSDYGLSLTLGGGEVTMTELATVYGTLANGGTRVHPNPILKITDYKNNNLENFSVKNNRVLSPQTAFLISDILSDNSARAPAFGFNSALVIPNHTVAVKTGTAETKRDNWTAGYSFGENPRLAIVWVGNNDNSPMSPYLESGNTGAAAMWRPLMSNLLKDTPDVKPSRPENLNYLEICAVNNLLPCANCPYIRTEYFTKGSEPKVACNFTKEEVEKILHPENSEKQ